MIPSTSRIWYCLQGVRTKHDPESVVITVAGSMREEVAAAPAEGEAAAAGSEPEVLKEKKKEEGADAAAGAAKKTEGPRRTTLRSEEVDRRSWESRVAIYMDPSQFRFFGPRKLMAKQQKAKGHISASNHGMLAKVVIKDVECSLLMPMTFMNNSGLSVKKLADRTGTSLEDILIVCDDLSLAFGKLRLRPSGSAGGHNGLKSIIKDLGSNQFARLRMGIDSP